MTRICLVNSQFPPHQHGGAENYVLRTAKVLRDRGHAVTVFTTKPYDGANSLRTETVTVEGVPVRRFYPANVSHRSGENPLGMVGKGLWHQIDAINPHARRVAAETFDEFEPDVVHTNNLMGISPRVTGAAKERGIPVVHTLHDYSLICPKSNLLRELTADGDHEICEDPPLPCSMYAAQKRRMLADVDVVTGPSRHVIEVHERHGFFENTDAVRVRLGVDTAASRPPDRSGDPAVLFVGKQLRAKGLDTLFEAAELLPEVTVHVCGTGPYDHRSEEAARTHENVIYHGFASEETLETLRREVTAAVVPSIWMENSPLAIYESFASGLPVVGSDVGGIPELVSSGERGVLFEPGDASALAAAIRRLAGSDASEMAENCLDWAREHTVEDHVNRLQRRVYDPALGESR